MLKLSTFLLWHLPMKLHAASTVGNLRLLASKPNYASIKDRMVAVVERRKGKSLRKIAKKLDRSVDFVRMWNNRFKEFGAPGLLDKSIRQATEKLNPEQRLAFRQRVLAGPRPEDQIRIFTTKALSKVIKNDFGVSYSPKAVSKLLKRLGLARIKPRPIHGKHQAEVAKAWVENDFPLF